jgi:hypothetical protein
MLFTLETFDSDHFSRKIASHSILFNNHPLKMQLQILPQQLGSQRIH